MRMVLHSCRNWTYYNAFFHCIFVAYGNTLFVAFSCIQQQCILYTVLTPSNLRSPFAGGRRHYFQHEGTTQIYLSCVLVVPVYMWWTKCDTFHTHTYLSSLDGMKSKSGHGDKSLNDPEKWSHFLWFSQELSTLATSLLKASCPVHRIYGCAYFCYSAPALLNICELPAIQSWDMMFVSPADNKDSRLAGTPPYCSEDLSAWLCWYGILCSIWENGVLSTC